MPADMAKIVADNMDKLYESEPVQQQAESWSLPNSEGNYCAHHPDDPAHGSWCAAPPVDPAKRERVKELCERLIAHSYREANALEDDLLEAAALLREAYL